MLRGVLCDIDGVLHMGMQPIEGARNTLQWLDQKGYVTRFVTNTTTMNRSTLAQRLQQIDLPIPEEHLLTAPVMTANYIRQHFPGQRCWVLTKGDTAPDFAGIELVEPSAENIGVVVIGGAEELLTYQAMNEAFQLVMNGAMLLAMHTNMYWKTSQGLQLDSGPFVRALEIATAKQAIVLGKPNRAFFEQGLLSLNMKAEEVLMVGDDVENDVKGAQDAGLRGVLVYSGKHKADSPLLQKITPDAALDSIADLPSYLDASDAL